MNKKYYLILGLLPLLAGSSYVVTEGNKEVAKVVTHDGSSEKEVVSKRELNEEASGFTKLKASELKQTEPRDVVAIPLQTQEIAHDGQVRNYGIVKGITELEVEKIASAQNMGIPNKSTEYSAGDTYPLRTWDYAYEDGGLKHSFKVSFDTDGEVVRINHQTEK